MNALRKRLRALGAADSDNSDDSDGGRRDALDGRRDDGGDSTPSTRKQLANRLQDSGEMRTPIPDSNLKPGADPRYLEALFRGDERTGRGFFDDDGQDGDPCEMYFSEDDGGDLALFGGGLFWDDRGQMTPATAARMAFAIAMVVLIGVGVAVPVIHQTVAAVSLSGVQALIAGFISTIVLLLLFIISTQPLR